MGAFGQPAYLACELCVCLMEIYRIVFCVLCSTDVVSCGLFIMLLVAVTVCLVKIFMCYVIFYWPSE